MTSITSAAREDLPALTGLRFFAAMAIVVHHLKGTYGVPADFLHQVQLGNGVSFFYVLSGFILTYVYWGMNSAEERRRYIIARVARIWPLHFATFVLVWLVINPPSRAGTDSGIMAAILNLSLLHAWIPDYRVFFSFNAVSWSLSVEMFFYLMFPLIMLRPARWVFLSLGAVMLLVLVAQIIGAGPYAPGDSSPTVTALLYINPAARLFEFVLGVVAAIYWRKKSFPETETGAVALQVAVLAFVVLSWVLAPSISTASPNLAIGEWLSLGGVTCLSSAALIVVFATGRGLARLIGAAPLVYLGKISFALYLVHQIPILAFNLGIGPFRLLSWWDYMALVIAASTLLHHVVETPARRAIVNASRRLEMRLKRRTEIVAE